MAKNKEPKHKGWELAPQESTKILHSEILILISFQILIVLYHEQLLSVDWNSSLDWWVGSSGSNNCWACRGGRIFKLLVYPFSDQDTRDGVWTEEGKHEGKVGTLHCLQVFKPKSSTIFSVFHREGPGGRVELGVSKVAMFSPAAKVIVKSLRKCTNFYVRLG